MEDKRKKEMTDFVQMKKAGELKETNRNGKKILFSIEVYKIR
jgi:hypothetical protein